MAWSAIPMHRDLERYTNAELRALGDVVVIFRRHFAWGVEDLTEEVIEPVELCRPSVMKFQLVRLRHDARDLRCPSFTYRCVTDVSDADLYAVRAHISLEEEVHFALKFVERDFYPRE